MAQGDIIWVEVTHKNGRFKCQKESNVKFICGQCKKGAIQPKFGYICRVCGARVTNIKKARK